MRNKRFLQNAETKIDFVKWNFFFYFVFNSFIDS